MQVRSAAVLALVGVILCSVGCGGTATPQKVVKTVSPDVKRKKCDEMSSIDGAVCYAEVAEMLFDNGKRSDAEKDIDVAAQKVEAALTEEHLTPQSLIDALTKVAPIQYKLGKRDPARETLKKAVTLVDKIEKPQDRASPLVAVATAQHGIKRTPDALETLKKAEELAGKVNDPWKKTDTLLHAAGGYTTLERPGDADRLLKEALEVAKGIEDPTPRSAAMATAARVLASNKKNAEATSAFKEARAVAESVQDPFKRVFALAEVGKEMVNAKMYQTGKEVLVSTIDLARQQKDQKSLEPIYRELEPYILRCNTEG